MKIKSFFLAIMIASAGAFLRGSSSWSDFKQDCKFGKEIIANKFYESFSDLEVPSIKFNQYFPTIDSSDVAIYSAPAWFVHGLHGYWQRRKVFAKAEQQNKGYYHSVIEKYKNFNKFHPVQSLRPGFPKVRNIPVMGPIFAAYLTGFVCEVLQNQDKK